MKYRKIDGVNFPVDNAGRIILQRKKQVFDESVLNLPKTPDKFISKLVREVNIGDYVLSTGIVHALNMNVGRHIPWIEDGLKRVERRMLYSMYKMKLHPNSKRAKVASIGGEVMKIHPHGETSAIEVVYRTGRSFAAMLPYIDGHGNFGNMDTLDAAAPRYAEARLSEYAEDCFFSEMDVETPIYDETETYDYSGYEPIFLPTKYPNILLQYSSGIGKGASSNIVAFNPTDVFEATIALIDNPDAKINIYPDTPNNLIITNKKELKNCFDKDRFKVRMRGTYRAYVDKKKVPGTSKLVDKYCLEFESCPMNTHGRAIKEFIIKLKLGNPDQYKEILDVQCAGDEENLRLIVEYEKGYDPTQVAEKLFKVTPLEQVYGADYTVVVNNKPERYSPRQLLLSWIDQRTDQKHRFYYQKALNYAKTNAKFEAYCTILASSKSIDKAVAIIKAAKNNEAAINELCNAFSLSRFQATEILKLKLSNLNKMGVDKIRQDADTALKNYKHCKVMLGDQSLIKNEIIDDLKYGIKTYGRPRRAKLMNLGKNGEDDNETKIIFYNSHQYFCVSSEKEVSEIASQMTADYKMLRVSNSSNVFLIGHRGALKILNGYAFTYTKNPISFDKIAFDNVSAIIEQTKTMKQITLVTKFGYAKQMLMVDVTPTKKIMPLLENDTIVSVFDSSNDGIVALFSKHNVYYVRRDSIPILKKGGAGNSVVKNPKDKLIGAVLIPESAKYMFILGEYGYVKTVEIEFLGFAKKKDNVITFDGKGIFDVIPFTTNMFCYDGSGNYNVKIVSKNNAMKFEFSNKKMKPVKIKLGTVVSSPTKMFKNNKSDFIKLVN